MTVTVVSCVTTTVTRPGQVDSPVPLKPPSPPDGEAGEPDGAVPGASDGAAPGALSPRFEGVAPPGPAAAPFVIGDSPPAGTLAEAVDNELSSTVMYRVL